MFTVKQLILLLPFVLIPLSSCEKYPKPGESLNKGAIIEDFGLRNCAVLIPRKENEWVITSLEQVDTTDGCFAQVRQFDFSSFSIIGKAFTFACNARIIREVTIDHQRKEYLFTIKYKEAGLCKRLGFNNNLVVVPKIPEDYIVTMELQKK